MKVKDATNLYDSAHFSQLKLAGNFNKLLQICRCQQFEAQQTIPYKLRHDVLLSCVETGKIAIIYNDSKGNEFLICYVYPGEFIPRLQLLEVGATHQLVLQAHTQSRIRRITANDMARAGIAPDAMERMQLAFSYHTSNLLARRLAEIATLNVQARIYAALLELARSPEAISHPCGMLVRITRQNLGRIANCSRESAGRALQKLEQLEAIYTKGKSIVILNKDPASIFRFIS
ncbi:MAG: helix-turn-helix domain-containing protein [Gammaproteobacteria bacterium]